MMKEKAKLPPSVAEVFELTDNTLSRCLHFHDLGREIDFNTLTLKTAQQLVDGGFPFLQLKILKLPKQDTKLIEKPNLTPKQDTE